MIDFKYKQDYTVDDLVEIVHILRSPGGCPWDMEQTHESIRRNFLEEAYEAAEAIDEGSTEHLREELGDVLMQVVFHADIERDAGRFDLNSVASEACKKLIYRHPHVFGDVEASDWEALKRTEKGQETHTDVLKAVARSLPGLWRAEKVQQKAAKAGFDWPDISGPLDKLSEETAELSEALREGSNVEEELGDLLFAAVKVARFAGVDPETALSKACDKFITRFAKVEATADKPLTELSLEEMNALWERAKQS